VRHGGVLLSSDKTMIDKSHIGRHNSHLIGSALLTDSCQSIMTVVAVLASISSLQSQIEILVNRKPYLDELVARLMTNVNPLYTPLCCDV